MLFYVYIYSTIQHYIDYCCDGPTLRILPRKKRREEHVTINCRAALTQTHLHTHTAHTHKRLNSLWQLCLDSSHLVFPLSFISIFTRTSNTHRLCVHAKAEYLVHQFIYPMASGGSGSGGGGCKRDRNAKCQTKEASKRRRRRHAEEEEGKKCARGRSSELASGAHISRMWHVLLVCCLYCIYVHGSCYIKYSFL